MTGISYRNFQNEFDTNKKKGFIVGIEKKIRKEGKKLSGK